MNFDEERVAGLASHAGSDAIPKILLLKRFTHKGHLVRIINRKSTGKRLKPILEIDIILS